MLLRPRLSAASLGFGFAILFAGCKGCKEDHETPARVVVVDAGTIAVDAAPLTGDLRGAGFIFDAAVYHFAAPGPAAEASAKKLLTEAGYDVRDTPLTAPPTKPTATFAHPKLSEFAPPSLETLRFRGKSLSEDEKARLQHAAAVTAVSFSGPANDSLPSYRAALRAMLALEKDAPGILWDEDARAAMTRAAWTKLLEDWSGDVPLVERHVSIDLYRDGELMRLVTLGMQRFALPDVVVNQVTLHDSKSMGALVNLVCQTLIERSVLSRPGELDVSVSTLTNSAAHDAYAKDTIDGGAGRGTLIVAIAPRAEGDAENRLLEIVFPGPAGQLQERQTAKLASILGGRDSLVHARHSDDILAASARARAKALTFKARFATKAPELESLMVKAPFKTSSGGNEWMWVEVVRWNGSTIQGVLQNDPYEVPGLKAGARVEVEESSIFDYIHRGADGGTEGNETGPMLEGQE